MRQVMGRQGTKIIGMLLIAGATLWGALFASGGALLVQRQEPYAGTDYLARCFYAGATSILRTEHRFVTLADMLRFKCPMWQNSRN